MIENDSSFSVFCIYNKLFNEYFVEKKVSNNVIPSLDIYIENINEPIIYFWKDCYFKKEPT